ncbi:glycosyltransferase [Tardiphaga sp. 604_B6_N1_1]|uniref:glycosyltransferase n=1 Tax=Tardiphaga sp. 604_B6_N1_1 TaxID=3240779 RepID=UPI003F241BF0
MNRTPIAFFAYNRPEHTDRALRSLSACRRFDECDLFLFADGPKVDASEASRAQIDATRAVLRHWAPRLDAELVERDANLGLARSIHSGATTLCDRYGRVIVVEDDLVLGLDFLDFTISALDRYADDAAVMQVGGYTLSPPRSLSADAFLLPVTTTWGWATWKRAWEVFSWQPHALNEARRDGEWKRLFDLDGPGFYSSMLEDRLAGRNDSWGILWWYAVSRRRGLVVYPAQTLVWNGGFDGSGVHCGDTDFVGQAGIDPDAWRLQQPPRFPTEIAYEPAHLRLIEAFVAGTTGMPAQASARSRWRSLLGQFRARLAHAFN